MNASSIRLMPEVDNETEARLMNYVKNKTKVTLQVKDLQVTTGVRHFPEVGELDTYITGVLQFSRGQLYFKEDGRNAFQAVANSGLSRIQEVKQGGKRKNRRVTKKARKNRRRYSRRK